MIVRLVCVALLLVVSNSFAQQVTAKDSVTFLKLGDSTYAIPQGCTAKSAYHVVCEDYQMLWIYLSNEEVKPLMESTYDGMKKNLPNFKKEEEELVVLGEACDGSRVSFTKDGDPIYQLIAIKPLGKFSAVIQIITNKEITSNDELPPFARKILKLTQ